MEDNEKDEIRINPGELSEEYQEFCGSLEMKLTYGEENEDIGEDRLHVRNKETGEECYVPFHPLLFREER